MATLLDRIINHPAGNVTLLRKQAEKLLASLSTTHSVTRLRNHRRIVLRRF